MGHLICISMVSNANMLIVAVVLLVSFRAEAVLSTFGNSKVAAERENVQNVNPTEYNMKFYPKEQLRAATVHKGSSYEAHNWTCPVNESGDHPSPWYRYLNSLYCEFSKYKTQVSKKSFNVANVEDWGRIHLPNLEKRPIYETEAWKRTTGQGIKINEKNFQNFLTKIEIYNIIGQSNIRSMEITREQLTELNHVLDLTIKDKMDISCKDSNIFITGNNILFSHINLSISVLPVGDKCRELLYNGTLKYLNIFASNTIFIDDDLQKRTNLIIIAPKFEIIGKRTINLNGEDGEIKDTTAPTEKRVSNGKDGEPGKPGKPGGNFFGIGEEFIGGENLTISANGGRGSPGQNGGNGVNGTDGVVHPVPTIRCSERLCEMAHRFVLCNGVNCLQYLPANEVYRIWVPSFCFFHKYGEMGFPGGKGGNGGKGGDGGYPGDILLLELNGRSNITQIKRSGLKGLDGKGGVGGAGGKNANTTIVRCYLATWSTIKSSFSDRSGPSGQNGRDGINTKNMEERKKATYISKIDKAKIINQYKRFLRGKMNDPFRNIFLENFLNRFQNNQDVKSIYDALGFVDELKSLEEQVHELDKDVNFVPFYGSLLDRISEYAQKVNSSDEKNVLRFLYTATLGRKHNLEEDLESYLITDITSYLKKVERQIQKLRDLENVEARQNIINSHKEKYKSEIDKKIKDANELISKEIKPQIQKIEAKIDNEIESLVNGVIRLRKQLAKEDERLMNKTIELQNALALQTLFGFFKVVGTVVSFMGPVGAIAGSVIGITTSLAETYMIDDTSAPASSIPDVKDSLSGDLKTIKEQISNFSNEKVAGLEKKLETVSEGIKNKNEFLDLYVNVSAIQKKLKTIDRNKITVQQVQDLEEELKTTIQKKRNDVKAQGGANDPKIKSATAVIDKLQNAVELSSVVIGAVNKYKGTKEKLGEIQTAIKNNTGKFDALRQYQAKIYDTIVPMFVKIENDLDDIISNSKTKAKVVLDVTKWKVQSTLKDLMSQMEQFTKSLNSTVNVDLVRCIEKLKDAMVMLLNVQGYIQDYQKDQTFANFIADISSATVIEFQDSYFKEEYRDALRELKIIITSSIVLERYKIAIDAFKLFVFPFANLYFEESELPSHFDYKKDSKLDDLISAAASQIEQIQLTLEEYNIRVNGYDRCVFFGEFNVTSKEPFFVWENNQHNNITSRLLSGEEVIVKADIKSSPCRYDAMKFNFVEFYFKSSNDTVQTGINEILKEYFINATHLGDSYYRYGGKTYLMTTPDLSFMYSFEKNQYGDQPSHHSSSVSKVKNGDFILSPYASWKIQLSERYKTTSFKSLEIYKDAVDFVLGGNGRYIMRGDSNCEDLTVDRYYKAINNNNTEYRMDEFDEDDFVPLLEDDILTGGRHEINRVLISASEKRRIARNNHARSEREKRRANFCN